MPQIRLRPPSKQEQLKLKVSPFAPISYNKYTHQLIDYHMHNHSRRILTAKSRIDTSIPKSAVKCVRSKDRFLLPAKPELYFDTPLDVESSKGSIEITQISKCSVEELFKRYVTPKISTTPFPMSRFWQFLIQ